MVSRRRFLTVATAGAVLVVRARAAGAQEGVFMKADDAPRRLFPQASDVAERTIVTTPALQRRIAEVLGRPPSLWERTYTVFTLRQGDAALGYVVTVEEIGKHRPISFAVGVNADGTIHDLIVLAYREAYGGEIRERRFLKQYIGKGLESTLRPYQDIHNISGATLSVEATGRAARKAIAVLKATGALA